MAARTFAYPEHLMRVAMAAERLTCLMWEIEQIQKDLDGGVIALRPPTLTDEEADAWDAGLSEEVKRRVIAANDLGLAELEDEEQ